MMTSPHGPDPRPIRDTSTVTSEPDGSVDGTSLDQWVALIDPEGSGRQCSGPKGAAVAVEPKRKSRRRVVQKPWVLCVDDDRDWVASLSPRFRQRGFELVRAHRGSDGCRYAFEFDPVAILLDLHLPGIDGAEVLHRLQSAESTRQIPVIMMTGRDEPGLKHRLMATGAADFVRKPVSHQLLIEMVQYHGRGPGENGLDDHPPAGRSAN